MEETYLRDLLTHPPDDQTRSGTNAVVVFLIIGI